jgi:glycosyltransferase involved in cell wall biosynthesis
MIVLNEAHRIEPVLKSIEWADEIVIIDAFSTDATEAICRRYTDRIYKYTWEGYYKQRIRSVEHALYPWILSVDGDEMVSDELKNEILAVINGKNPKNGYYVPRKTRYLGRWIENSGWYPDYQLRLFRAEDVFIEPRLVHEGFSVRGEVGHLNGVLYHFSIDSIRQHVEKINHYTSLDCPQKIQRLGNKKVHWYNLIFNPLFKFIRMYFSNKGYKDGFQGFILALLSAFSTQLLYIKVWEAQYNQRTRKP